MADSDAMRQAHSHDGHAHTHPGGDIPHTHGPQGTDAHAHATEWGDGRGHHTHWKKYAAIGALLTVITAVEVVIYEMPSFAAIIVPLLLVLSTVKFVIVVLYYMHLKQDDAVFSRVFWGPMFLAILVVLGMVILFKILPAYGVFTRP